VIFASPSRRYINEEQENFMPNDDDLEDFHLQNAPIMEALIEIKLAEPLPDDMLRTLRECADGLGGTYPIREDMQTQQVQFQFGTTPFGAASTRPVGFLCKDADSHHVVQLRLDGFALSELKPYSSWNGFFPEAQRIWEQYRAAVGGAPLGRWSIRYINRISWPEGEKIEEYLNVYPALPEKLPQQLVGCFMRLQSAITVPSDGLFTQQIFGVPMSEPGRVSFIVDHDFSFSAIGLSDSILWERIESARDIKNSFFKATVTPKALEMFQ
jgi:uncharacterized protein (TIGR04255 family)